MPEDPLDYSLPWPWRKYHFTDQDQLTRWRIEAAEGPPTVEEIAREKARIEQMKSRLIRLADARRGG